MTAPIDLDLVELRCRLRGWKCVRFVEDGIDCVSVECRFGGEIILGAGGVFGTISPWNTPAHKRIEALLTAPRWTLERLLSEPPEGWRYDAQGGYLSWSEDECITAVFFPGRVLWDFDTAMRMRGSDAAAFAAKLKAAAELALILAEVEP